MSLRALDRNEGVKERTQFRSALELCHNIPISSSILPVHTLLFLVRNLGHLVLRQIVSLGAVQEHTL